MYSRVLSNCWDEPLPTPSIQIIPSPLVGEGKGEGEILIILRAIPSKSRGSRETTSGACPVPSSKEWSHCEAGQTSRSNLISSLSFPGLTGESSIFTIISCINACPVRYKSYGVIDPCPARKEVYHVKSD